MKTKRPTQRDPAKVAFSVALPRVLVRQIADIAASETRKRNGQIEHFLSAAVAAWKRTHPEVILPATYAQPEPDLTCDLAAEVDAPPLDPAAKALRARASRPTPPPTAPKRPRPGAA